MATTNVTEKAAVAPGNAKTSLPGAPLFLCCPNFSVALTYAGFGAVARSTIARMSMTLPTPARP